MKFTILYYTSCKEDEKFEDKIKKNLLAVCGNIPIISVSQKPIDFGRNICVGDVGVSNHNVFRQIQVGCKEANTPFVISAEADCLYPPDYFQFVPLKTNECYKCTNNYVLNEWGKGQYSGFYQKEIGLFAMITGRDYLIREIDEILQGKPIWNGKRHRYGRERPMELFRRKRWQTFHIENPIVSLKTLNGMNKHTRIIEPPIDEIPYWGKAVDLRKRMFYEN